MKFRLLLAILALGALILQRQYLYALIFTALIFVIKKLSTVNFEKDEEISRS